MHTFPFFLNSSHNVMKKYDVRYKGATPMIKQFLRIKKEYPDCLIFYRMGDFYELFFEDAIVASNIMDISLTERGKTADGEGIPMCGVPCHVYESYLYKLVKSGFRVAICEQVDYSYNDRIIRGYNKLLHREVVRIVTPGTLTEENFLSSRENSFLMSVFRPRRNSNTFYISYIDISTGSFFIEKSDSFGFSSSLSRFSPKEVLLPERLFRDSSLIKLVQIWTNSIVSLPEVYFDEFRAKSSVKKAFNVNFLDVLGSFCSRSWISAGVLLNYIRSTQKGILPYISIPRDLNKNNFLYIDAATRSNLELDKSLSGKRSGSLLAAIDNTLTGFGSRCLSYDLSFPLTNKAYLQERLDFVACCIRFPKFIEKSRFYLKMVPDIERSIARLSLNRGGPRDLGIIKDTIYYSSLLRNTIIEYNINKSILGNKCLECLVGYYDIYNVLSNSLSDNLSFTTKMGGFISFGYSKDLDLKIKLRDNKHLLIRKLKEIYIKKTSVFSLKIKHNNIIGYYIEVSNQHKGKFLNSYFINRQNLSNSIRFTTYELSNLELNLNKIIAEISELERKIYKDLVSFILTYTKNLSLLSNTLARLDVIVSHAFLALSKNYVQPIVDDSNILYIKKGRHPIVDASLKFEGKNFIANDCDLRGEKCLWLVTGPNMAGKSTFLRQNAIIVILAQIGSFVPAKKAHIGICDRLFSRIGASDNLARGLSTFMTEMLETSAILRQSTRKSLVILDEVGRGTSTYDGLSIAFSVLEELYYVIKCRTLFATHYHELRRLGNNLVNISYYTFKVKESKGDIIFLYELVKGYSNVSYGIHVARIAGLPFSVLSRAEIFLKRLEKKSCMYVFEDKDKSYKFYKFLLLLGLEIKNLSLDDTSPKDALDILYYLKNRVN